MPTHIDIIDSILTDILTCGLKNGDQIDSIPVLCRKYSVSDQTIQKALKKLKESGILFSKPGKGVFVKDIRKIGVRKVLLKVAVMDCDTPGFIQDAADAFERNNQNVKILWERVSHELSLEDLASKYSPDLVIFEESNLDSFMAEDVWDNIEDTCYNEDSYPQLSSGCCSGGSRYARPIFFSPNLIIYNKKIVKDAGVNMPERWDIKSFSEIAEKLTGKALNRRVFGFMLSHSLHSFPALITAFGGNLQNMPASSDSIKKALAFSLDLIEREISPRAIFDEYRFCFEEGYGAMRIDSFNGLRHRANIPFEWDLMPFPKNNKRGTSCFCANYAGILKAGANNAFAQKFLKYLFSEDVQKTIKRKCFLIPANKNISEDRSVVPVGYCPENYYVFNEEIPAMQPMHKLFDPEIKKWLLKEMFMLFNKIKTVDDVSFCLQEKQR